jgi:hypothetical protein
MVRFLADASLHHAIVTGCARREPAIDVLCAQSATLDGMSDPDVFGIAASQDRILVTHDFRTMPKHFRDGVRSCFLHECPRWGALGREKTAPECHRSRTHVQKNKI